MNGTGLRTVVAFHVSAPSGPSRTLAPVLRRLAGSGRVVVAVPELGPLAGELEEIGPAVATGHRPLLVPRRPHDAWRVPGRLRRDTARFRALLREQRADLVLVATTRLPALALGARLEGVPAIVYASELYRQGRRGDAVRSRAGRALVRLNARFATVTVAASRTVAAQLPAAARPVVAYPSIEPAVAEGDGAAFRREHRLQDASPLLLTLGNITVGRGQDVAIRALAELRREHPRAALAVGGEPHPTPADQAYAARLRDLARRLGLEEAVRFCGFVRPGDALAACDVFLNPARVAETFGRAAMESLLAGRPVVSSRVGGVPEVLDADRHALLVPPGEPRALAAAVARLVGDPQLAARLAATGRRHVRAEYNVDRQRERFDAAIGMALDGRRAT